MKGFLVCCLLWVVVPASVLAQPIVYTPNASRNAVLERHAAERGVTREQAAIKLLDDRLDFLRGNQVNRNQAIILRDTEKCLSRGQEYVVRNDAAGLKTGVCQ